MADGLRESHEASAGRDSAIPTQLLAVLPSGDDQAVLRDILGDSPWNLRFASTFQEAQAALRQAATSVVISECALPDGRSLKDLLDDIETLVNPPRLIVVSRLTENLLWAEVLQLGGCDLLAKPFAAEDVIWAVTSASLSWRTESDRRERPGGQRGTTVRHSTARC